MANIVGEILSNLDEELRQNEQRKIDYEIVNRHEKNTPKTIWKITLDKDEKFIIRVKVNRNVIHKGNSKNIFMTTKTWIIHFT